MSQFEREVLGGGERHARRRDALDGGVVGEVEEEHGALDGRGRAELGHEEVGVLEGDAHRGEDDGELALLFVAHLRRVVAAREHAACRAICAASSLCGRPEPEKIGSFWPRTSGLSPSIEETPVWMKSSGKSRLTGLIGAP